MDMKEWTISWEEALEREMEYRKRMKNKSPMPQHSVDSMVLPSGSQSQEQMQEANATGLLKRKDTSEIFPHQAEKSHEKMQEANATGLLKRKGTSETFPHQAKTALECTVSHEKMQEANATELLKRKGTSETFPHQAKRVLECAVVRSQKIDAQKAPSQKRHDGLLGPLPFLNKKLPPQQSNSHQPPLKPSNYYQSLPCHPQVQNTKTLLGGLPNQRAPQNLVPVHWCSLCNVKCMTSLHLELHRRGKKHKAKLEGVRGANKNNRNEEIWCPECNVKCVNEFSWSQHRMGQKHLVLLAKKAIEASGSAGPVMIRCAQGSQRAPCTEEQDTKVNMEMPDNKLMSSAAKRPKLRTTNWPNCKL